MKAFWTLVFVGGALGWWSTLAASGLIPSAGYWWHLVAMLVSIGCFLKTWKTAAEITEKWLEQWVNRHGYRPAHVLRREKQAAEKWITGPYLAWWLPTLFSFIAGVSGGMAF